MIPEELAKIFEEYDYDDLKLYIRKVDFYSDIFTFNVEIKTDANGYQASLGEEWIVNVTGQRENRISFDLAADIDIKEDHPLLWKYTDLQCELYFSGICADPGKVFLDMYQTHYSLFRKYIPFETYLNSNSFNSLFKMAGGLLARGPKTLLLKYAESLNAQGLDFSIIGERLPTYWDGNSFVPENRDLKVLFMSETSTYIIGQSFDFIKQNKN